MPTIGGSTRGLFRPLARTIFLTVVGAALLIFALRPRPNRTIRIASIAMLTIAAFFAAANIADFYRLLLRGQIRSGFPIPLSLLILLSLGWILHGIARAVPASATRRHTIVGFLAAA